MNNSPLQAAHEQSGARFVDDAPLPRSYGDVAAEYEAIRTGVAVLDFSSEGRFEVSGKNAVQFINGLVTNDIRNLQANRGLTAAFLDAQGRTQAICRFYNTGDHLLLTTHPERREKVYKNLHRFTLAGEFFLKDVTDQQALISLQGPQAAALLAALAGQNAAPEKEELTAGDIAGQRVLIARHDRCGTSGIDLFVAAEGAAQVWRAIIDGGSDFGARPAGQEAFDIARIEAGIPLEVADVSESNILVEAGFADALSYSKGCYLGQEIIARIYFRGQPAKRLLRLDVSADEMPPSGADLYASDGKKVGLLTSVARNPVSHQIVALGYVHRYYLTKGTELTIRSGEQDCGSAVVSEGVAESAPSKSEGPVVSHKISQIIT